jgi:hypothetical protein
VSREIGLPARPPPSLRDAVADGITLGVSAWRAEADDLALVSQGAELHAMVAEAAIWAERITCCLTAPHSERGTLPWWGELLARSSKCAGMYVRQGERAEGWLLHRLHSLGVLRLVDVSRQPLAHDLWIFERGSELRVLMSHIPLERAVTRAAFGTLLSFQGSSAAGGEGAGLAHACRAEAASWAELARIPTGREIDVMALDARRRKPRPALDIPPSLRVVSEPTSLAACLERFTGMSDARGMPGGALGAARSDPHTAIIRAFAGGYRLSPALGNDARFVLTLYAGAAWAAGTALLLDDGAGRSLLVWRGDLLGPSRSRAALVWSEARLASFVLEDPARELAQRVAVVAHSNAPLGPQLAAFSAELERLSDVFGVEPPPALGHVLADFATLSAKQQSLLVWRALIGGGACPLDRAATIAAESLRSQGYLRGSALEAGGVAHRSIASLLEDAAKHGRNFDRPAPATVRAIQPDASAYVLDDWLECLLLALPEKRVVAQRTALRLAHEWAREHWGLSGGPLRRNGSVERALESAVASALCRGLLIRVGAAGLQRLTIEMSRPDPPPGALVANASEQRFVDGWARALGALDPLRRLLLARRSGWYGRRELLASLARRLGVSVERARQLECDAWRRVEVGSGWARALRARLERALAGAPSLPVRQLVRDDAWWQGLDQRLELADALFEGLLGASLHRVELELPEREVFIARFSQAELDQTLASLLERASRIATPTGIDAYHRLCDASCSPLDEGLCEYLREALTACLELDPADSTRVLGFGAPAPAERSPGRSALDDADLPIAADAALAGDVPGGQEAIAAVLCDVTEALEANQRPLDFAEAWAFVQKRVQHAWTPELMLQIIDDDPALLLSPAHETSLRRWQLDAGPLGEQLCPGIPVRARARLEQLMQQAPPAPGVLAQRLTAELERLERAADSDDLQALSMARQLADLSERWLEQAATEPPDTRRLMQAAMQLLLDAIAPREDDFDAIGIDRHELLEARAVLAAVLRWQGLDWLELSSQRSVEPQRTPA